MRKDEIVLGCCSGDPDEPIIHLTAEQYIRMCFELSLLVL
jgi:hypothetical protein